MYSIMKRLIERKFYKTMAEAQERIDVVFAVGRLNGDAYAELAALCEAVYAA